MNWSQKKCVVTGGSGFLGSHLADSLLELGAEVTVIDTQPLPAELEGRVNFMRTDITEADLPQVDFLFHLAALAYPSACNDNPSLAIHSNVDGTQHMLESALKRGVKKFVFPSSALLYGRFPKYVPIDENHPIDYTDSFYSISKKFGEDMCSYFQTMKKLPVVYFRLFNAFGPRQAKEYLIPTIISQAMETGVVELWNEKPTRDFTYVSDTVRAFTLAAESPFLGGPLNIGSGTETSVGDISKLIASSFGADIRFLNKDVIGSLRLQCNNARAKQAIGWEPTVSFRDGLEKTIAWYKEQNR